MTGQHTVEEAEEAAEDESGVDYHVDGAVLLVAGELRQAVRLYLVFILQLGLLLPSAGGLAGGW